MLDFCGIGNKLHKLRTDKGYNQEQIAEKLYVSRQAVSRWELGQTLPSIDNLIELSKLFQVSFEEILCMDDNPIDENKLFAGHSREYIMTGILNGKIKVDIAEVLYQFSGSERMIILRAVKDGKLLVNKCELAPRLSLAEQRFLRIEA